MRPAGIVLPLALALLASPCLAGGAPLCEARFEVEGEPLLPGASAPDAVVVSAGRVSIGGCAATRARARETLAGTRARVRFSSFCPAGRLCSTGSFVGDVRHFTGGGRRLSRCEAAKGVRLEVWIDPGCQTLAGRIRARSPHLDREFVAALAPPEAPPAPDCVPTSTAGSCAE
jgi:hypothetical protein